MESIVIPKDPSDDLIRLRHAVQDTLTAARTLGLVPDDDFEKFSNTTIESMSAEMMQGVLRLAESVYKQYSGVIFSELKKRAAIAV